MSTRERQEHEPPEAVPQPGTRRFRPRTAVAGLVAAGLTAGGLVAVPAFAINSNPPTGPGNVEIFPKRDMVAIDGYLAKAGQAATFTVTRAGQKVGTAVGTVGDDGFLEVNHPGGVCWSDVTPNLVGGDEVRVDFADGTWDAANTSTAQITGVERVATGNPTYPFGVRITGTYGPDVDVPLDTSTDPLVDPGKFGVEIVNPDMRISGTIKERAIGWPNQAPATYSVEGAASAGTFTVTYGAATAHDQDLMMAGDPSVSAWQHTPAGVEAQMGLTISEFNEIDGPGFGGCPAGPDALEPDSPTEGTATGGGDGVINVGWQPGSVAPAAAPIHEYRVRAVLAGKEIGQRLGADARTHSFSGLVAGQVYDIEITAVSTSGESFPPLRLRAAASVHVAPEVVPTTSAAFDAATGAYTEPLVGDKGIHFDRVAGSLERVHYTTDGTQPTTASRAWEPGFAPIQLRADTTLNWFAVDTGNNAGPSGSRHFDLQVAGMPTQPTGVLATALDRGATVSWVNNTLGTSHDVLVYESAADGTNPTLVRTDANVATRVEAATATEPERLATDISALTAGRSYRFAVVAHNDVGTSGASALSDPVVPIENARADAGPDLTTMRGSTVVLDGSASAGEVGYRWEQVGAGTDAASDPAVTLVLPAGNTAATHTDGTSFNSSPTASFVFPKLTDPTDPDHQFAFRLTVLLSNGTTMTDDVLVTATPDVVVINAKYQAGNELRVSGTGSVPGAVLAFRNEANSTTVLTRVTVGSTGSFSFRLRNITLTPDTLLHVHSDYGFSEELPTS